MQGPPSILGRGRRNQSLLTDWGEMVQVALDDLVFVRFTSDWVVLRSFARPNARERGFRKAGLFWLILRSCILTLLLV